MSIIQLPDQTRMLLIHIPRTGASSVQAYFHVGDEARACEKRHTTLQETLREHNLHHVKVETRALIPEKVWTVVRHPYTRIMSVLFHYHLVQIDSTPARVFKAISRALRKVRKHGTRGLFHGAFTPQYQYVTDEFGNFYPNVLVLKQEQLTQELHALGFRDFDKWENINSTYMEKHHRGHVSVHEHHVFHEAHEAHEAHVRCASTTTHTGHVSVTVASTTDDSGSLKIGHSASPEDPPPLSSAEDMSILRISIDHGHRNVYMMKRGETLDYLSYLNADSMALINHYYEQDFRWFSYDTR